MLEKGHYHFAGVAGVGMSALAQAALGQGCDVSGSDRYRDRGQDTDVIGKLVSAGVKFTPQDGSGITAATKALVVSTAIEGDNPDIAAAKKCGVPVLHRSELLHKIVDGHRCVAVTGTSGKSTVTGMTGWILEQLGADPSVVNGAPLLNWMSGDVIGNARIGKSDLWVIEADESDRSLLNYSPDWAVITNASMDHFSLEETVQLFKKFAGRAKRGVVSALDNPSWLKEFKPEVKTDGSSFKYGAAQFAVHLPGAHNAENALFAVVLCEKLGFKLKDIGRALAGFKGIHRRLERVGTAGGITVVDDYAHNPAKIAAAWRAAAGSGGRVIGIWRPHGFKPLAMMMEELMELFGALCRAGDKLYILPVYDAGGTADRAVNSDRLVNALRAKGVPAEFINDAGQLPVLVAGQAKRGDVVLTMGARDPGLPTLARSILSDLS